VRPHFQPHPSRTSGYGNTIDLFIPVAEAHEATITKRGFDFAKSIKLLNEEKKLGFC